MVAFVLVVAALCIALAVANIVVDELRWRQARKDPEVLRALADPEQRRRFLRWLDEQEGR